MGWKTPDGLWGLLNEWHRHPTLHLAGRLIGVHLNHWDSSKTSMPETVALFAMGSKVRFSFPCADGFKW